MDHLQKIKLYCVQQSFYSGKIRAYLLQRNLPFEEILATGKIYKEIILKKAGYPVVPLISDPNTLQSDQNIENDKGKHEDTYIQDTSDMMDYFEYTYPPKSIRETCLPSASTSPKQRLTILAMEILADNYLNIHAMHYRWSFPEQLPFLVHSWETNMIDRPSNKVLQSTKQFGNGRFFLGVTKDTIPVLEKQYLHDILGPLNEHFKFHPFIMGGRPCMADYALMGPLYAHLYRDPIPGQIMMLHAPRVASWVDRMNKSTVNEWRPGVDDESLLPTYGPDGLLPNDEISEHLMPLLTLFFRDQVPLLNDFVSNVHTYYNRQPQSAKSEEVPRHFGQIKAFFEGVETKTGCRVYPQWMLQRLTDEMERCMKERNQTNEVLDWWESLGASKYLDSFNEWYDPISSKIKRARLYRKRGTKTHGDALWFVDSKEETEKWMPKWLDGCVLHGVEKIPSSKL